MRRFFNKLLPLCLCVAIALSATLGLVGCGRPEGSEEKDEARTQLYIGAYGGGYGTAWLDGIKEGFEEFTKEMSFEDGKTGVQVFYTVDKDKYTPSALEPQIQYDTNEIFFASGDDILDTYIRGNKLLDITDVVTANLTEFGENESIEDKMDQAQISHYKRDGKYYMLPDLETSLGVIYDKDLFVSKQLYFAKGGCSSEFSVYTQANNTDKASGSYSGTPTFTGSGAKSAGPDGKYGTIDDGLPATIAEYKLMLKRMSDVGVDPIVWSEQYESTYTPFFLESLWADYQGKTEGQIVYSGIPAEGINTRLITSFNGNTPVVETVKVMPEDYCTAIANQAGRYYGLELMEYIVKGGYVSDYSFQSLSHIETQERFLASKFRDDRPIAMMIDGTWWETESEASENFKDLVDSYGEDAARENRNFGLFPMPKISENEIGTPSTMTISGSVVFVNGNIAAEKVALAKLFIKYINSDEAMRRVTLDSGVPKALDYEFADGQVEQLSGFARNFWEASRAAEKIYDLVPESLRNNTTNYQMYKNVSGYNSANANSQRYSTFVQEFEYNTSGQNLTAKEFFLGIKYYV